MNICLDGFALSLKEGTGLATYSREVVHTLKSHENNVSLLYGMDRLGYNSELKWSRFVQRLYVNGGAGGREIRRYQLQALVNAFPFLLGLSLRSEKIQIDDFVDVSGIRKHLPEGVDVYNLSSMYRLAQVYASFLSKPLKVKPPKHEDVDLFHNTFSTPVHMPGVPNVVTLHDLIRIVLPYSTKDYIRLYRKRTKASLKKADQIFVVSEASKRDLQTLFNVPDSKISVTYQSVQIPKYISEMSDEKLANILQQSFKLKPKEYFLFIGTIEPKKNVDRIIEAAAIANTPYPLVIAGKDGWMFEKTKKKIKEIKKAKTNYVKRFSYLPRLQQLALLKGAKALVFPSLYEGFGLPVLEAMKLGVPVITSNVSSIPEVGGDAVHYVNPYQSSSIAKGMEKITVDDDFARCLSQKGLEQAKKFTSESHYALLQEGYEKAIKAFK